MEKDLLRCQKGKVFIVGKAKVAAGTSSFWRRNIKASAITAVIAVCLTIFSGSSISRFQKGNVEKTSMKMDEDLTENIGTASDEELSGKGGIEAGEIRASGALNQNENKDLSDSSDSLRTQKGTAQTSKIEKVVLKDNAEIDKQDEEAEKKQTEDTNSQDDSQAIEENVNINYMIPEPTKDPNLSDFGGTISYDPVNIDVDGRWIYDSYGYLNPNHVHKYTLNIGYSYEYIDPVYEYWSDDSGIIFNTRFCKCI
ncbi:MAG: hypothetical protein MJ124_10095 [Lachnospiraceae bacterium]|nr:hypothetical protein [Lachnospiraceae bacterium]